MFVTNQKTTHISKTINSKKMKTWQHFLSTRIHTILDIGAIIPNVIILRLVPFVSFSQNQNSNERETQNENIRKFERSKPRIRVHTLTLLSIPILKFHYTFNYLRLDHVQWWSTDDASESDASSSPIHFSAFTMDFPFRVPF